MGPVALILNVVRGVYYGSLEKVRPQIYGGNVRLCVLDVSVGNEFVEENHHRDTETRRRTQITDFDKFLLHSAGKMTIMNCERGNLLPNN